MGQLKVHITSVVEPGPDSSHCDYVFQTPLNFFTQSSIIVIITVNICQRIFFVCGSKGLAASKAHQQMEIFSSL